MGHVDASPDEIGAEEGHRPAVVVLLVNGPLGAEIIDQQKPVGGEHKQNAETLKY